MYQNRYTNIGIIFLFQSKNKENSALLYCQGYMNSQKKIFLLRRVFFCVCPWHSFRASLGEFLWLRKKMCVERCRVFSFLLLLFALEKHPAPLLRSLPCPNRRGGVFHRSEAEKRKSKRERGKPRSFLLPYGVCACITCTYKKTYLFFYITLNISKYITIFVSR